MKWSNLWMLAATCSIPLVLPFGTGCAGTNVRVISADAPVTPVSIGRFEVRGTEVDVFQKPNSVGLRDNHGREVDRLTVRLQDEFEARGFNCSETWKLVAVSQGHGTFDVRGRAYDCTDPMAILFGIPSHTYRCLVVVCPYEGEPGEGAGGTNQTDSPGGR